MNLRKVFSFAVGPLGVAVLGALTLPLLTWFFSQADIGRLAMFQLLVSFSILFCSVGLDQAFIREYHEVDSKARLLKVAAYPGILVLFLVSLIFILIGASVGELFLDKQGFQFDLLLLVAVLSGYAVRFVSLSARMEEQGLIFSLSLVLPKVLFLTFLALLYYTGLERELVNLLLLQVLSVACIAFYLLWLKRNIIIEMFVEKYDIKQLSTMLRYSWPLVFSSLAYWGLTAMDKVFIKELSTFEELGVYSVAISFASAAIIVQSIFSTIWAPMVYKWVAQNRNLHKIAIIRELLLVAIIAIVLIASMLSWLTEYFLPLAYADVQYLLVICMIQPLLYTLSEVTKVGIGVTRRSMFSLVATLVALFINLIGNYCLIPIYGANGAAIATALSFLAFFIIRTEASIYVWMSIPRAKMYMIVIVLVFFCIVFSLYAKYIDNELRFLVGLLFLLPFLIYYKRAKMLFIKIKEN